MKVAVTLSSRDYDAVLFDLNGVLTRTARVHAAAFSSEELRQLFEPLGYPFEYETIPRNIAYYAGRLSRGSTLCRAVYAWVMARSDPITLCVDVEICEFASGTTRVFRLNDDATDRGTHRDVPGDAP